MRAGLSLREVKIYLALLTEGELMASELSKKTGIIRTNVYDILHTLLKKGTASSVIRSGKQYFRAAPLDKVIDYIDTQQKNLEEVKGEINTIMPQLHPLREKSTEPIIEVYEGREGLKTILARSVKESLKTGKEILGISVQQQKCRELAGPYHVRWYTDRGKYKIKSRYLMSAEEDIIPVNYTEFKVLPPDAKNPNEIFVFGDITSQFLFVRNCFSAIVIDNAEITRRYREYFEFLWNIVPSPERKT